MSMFAIKNVPFSIVFSKYTEHWGQFPVDFFWVFRFVSLKIANHSPISCTVHVSWNWILIEFLYWYFCKIDIIFNNIIIYSF